MFNQYFKNVQQVFEKMLIKHSKNGEQVFEKC